MLSGKICMSLTSGQKLIILILSIEIKIWNVGVHFGTPWLVITAHSDRQRGIRLVLFLSLHQFPDLPVLSYLSRTSVCNQCQRSSVPDLTFQNKAWCQWGVSDRKIQRGEWSEQKQKGANEHVGSSQVVSSDDKVAFTCLLCSHLT